MYIYSHIVFDYVCSTFTLRSLSILISLSESLFNIVCTLYALCCISSSEDRLLKRGVWLSLVKYLSVVIWSTVSLRLDSFCWLCLFPVVRCLGGRLLVSKTTVCRKVPDLSSTLVVWAWKSLYNKIVLNHRICWVVQAELPKKYSELLNSTFEPGNFVWRMHNFVQQRICLGRHCSFYGATRAKVG